ncbi:MAG TPA: TetR/AcrR family transcriptional regulator [Verrucomicrobiae bacterium]|nr:TetR/AcrR family transcriptional regulator [Verrucomicrobiae bacterium]
MLNRVESGRLPETKRKLVDAGVNLMRQRGFNATTVDDICSEAGVTKGGFFHYFKSKDDLAAAALVRFHETKAAEFAQAPFRRLSDPLDRVFGRLEFAKQSVGGTKGVTRGCLIGMFAQELSLTHAPLRTICQDKFADIAKDFEQDLADAKALHAPGATFDPKSLATLYVSIIQGSLMLAKASESNRVLFDNLEQFRLYLQSLFSQARKGKGWATPTARN